MLNIVRKYARTIIAAYGFLYDYYRYVRFSAWKSDMRDISVRNYHVVKIYHALEKSMSYRSRDPKHGWSTAISLLSALKEADHTGFYGFHDKVGAKVLMDFVSLPDNEKSDLAIAIRSDLLSLNIANFIPDTISVRNYSLEEFNAGKLESPDEFFMTRYSLREYKSETVNEDVIKKAISLALKTPSVCNRQPWHIYYTDEKQVIEQALSLQTGNRGFGHSVPNLMIVTVDLKAFMPGNEHYQHWIDGGMISMSLVYALHSLGIASCCLNWSQSPSNDIKLRKKLNIHPEHTVIMMLAFGYPDLNNIVCESARRPIEQFVSKLSVR